MDIVFPHLGYASKDEHNIIPATNKLSRAILNLQVAFSHHLPVEKERSIS